MTKDPSLLGSRVKNQGGTVLIQAPLGTGVLLFFSEILPGGGGVLRGTGHAFFRTAYPEIQKGEQSHENYLQGRNGRRVS